LKKSSRIAEYFRVHGFDGIAYRSLLGDGHNIPLFDLDTADLIECRLFRVKAVTFESAEEHYE
jgi:hypothetical protein